MNRCTRSAPGSGFEKSTNWSEPAEVEAHARPLLDVVAAAREVDAVDAADAPLGIRQAARVAVHDRVVGDARGERVVLRAVGRLLAGALLLLVRAAALLRAALARRSGADLDGVARDLTAARLLGELLELVGGLVDGLQVALVLELPARRRDVGMPDLREPAPRELYVALAERRLDLKQQDGLLDVQHLWHDLLTVASGPGPGGASLRAGPPALRHSLAACLAAVGTAIRCLVTPTHFFTS
jgi:hypothetical protein